MKNELGVIKRVFSVTRQFWGPVLILFLLTLLATPIALLKPFALKLVIDSGFGAQPVPGFIGIFFPEGFRFSIGTIALLAAILVVLIALLDNIQTYIVWVMGTRVGEKLVLAFRTLLFNHVQRLSLGYHDTKGTSDSLYRIQWDSQSARSLLISQIPAILSSALTLIAMIIIMFVINIDFAIIALCLLPPLYILSKISTRLLRKDWYKVKEAESNAMTVVNEVLSSLRVVKAFGREEQENERFNEKSNTAVKGQIKLAKMAAGFSFLVGMVLALASAGFIYLGATYVNNGKMTLGELILVMAYLTQLFGPIQSIIKNINDLQSSITGIERFFKVLDEEKEVKELPNAHHLTKASGGFSFENVSFSYNKEKPILKNVSFEVYPGDRVGIMGSTGAGKSTLINLLNRFYDPVSGIIKIDGADIRDFKLADYRSQFAIVLQEPILFSTTLAENIRYGNPDATDEEVREAAVAANAHEFVMRSKDGYEAQVGDRGFQLSGGERQRISIARAFIKNAPVLILDEPTSSLDIRTEALIMEAMERLMLGRTTFMISHRLDTLNTCNLILHLENGELTDVIRDHDEQLFSDKKKSFLEGDL